MSFDIEQCVYRYLSGPLETEEKLQQGFAELNCRRAMQYYFWKIHGLFLPPDKIQMPDGYRSVGTFLSQGDMLPLEQMETGDIVYAQNTVAKKGGPLLRNREDFETEEEWLMQLHTAVFLPPDNASAKLDESTARIWHASHFEGKVCTWTIEHFRQYYTPVAVKRILSGESTGISIPQGKIL